MEWLEITISTAAADIKSVTTALTGAGFSDLVIEDQEEFETFLDENRAYWDYIDEEFQNRLQGLSRIKLYLESDDRSSLDRLTALIVRLCKRKLEKSNEDTTLRKFDAVTAKDIFDEAKAGDVIAVELVDEVGEILGSALSNMACVVNPEVIVIGGGVSKAGAILIDTIQKHFIETAFHVAKDTKFALASLGNDAGIYGCMQMILE